MRVRPRRASPHQPTTANPRGAGFKVAAGVGFAVLAITALVFSNSYATRDLVKSGLSAVQAQAALGTNDIAFKALGQAVLLAEDHALGVAGEDVLDEAVAEARSSLDDLDTEASLLLARDHDSDIAAAVSSAITAADQVLAAVDARDAATAAENLAAAQPAFEETRDALFVGLTMHGDALIAADGVASRMGNISRFLVALLLPLGAIVAYRYAARRQLRMAEVQLDARLSAEHEIHRAKDEFIANMSHELRTPLTSIYGFSEVLIETGLVDPESAMDLICTINGESAELGRMVEDLLVSARSAANALAYSYGPVDLSQEAVAVITPLTRTGATVEVDLPTVAVWADPLRSRQVIRNLVSNAIRHGGSRILVSGIVTADRVSVAVMDDGPGVPDDMVPRLFSRFVHDGEAALTEGSVGLGLAVVKELVGAMGGDLGYRRTGTWSTFEFWLPRADEGADTSVESPVLARRDAVA